jgi:hypothetical protein
METGWIQFHKKISKYQFYYGGRRRRRMLEDVREEHQIRMLDYGRFVEK